MRNNHMSSNPVIDYDAIMNSIKIDHTVPLNLTMHSQSKNMKKSLEKYAKNISTFHPDNLGKQNTEDRIKMNGFNEQSFNNSKQNLSTRVCISQKDGLEKNSAHIRPSCENKNYIFSSIVYDDFSKQSCFQSVYRQPNQNPYKKTKVLDSRTVTSKPTQFKLYIADSTQMQSNRQNYQITKNIRTPNKFKQWKVSTVSQIHQNSHNIRFQQSSNDKGKQNNRNAQNHNQSYSYKQGNTGNQYNPYIEREHRYLSHTETSGNKIRARKQSIQRYKNKITPVKSKKQVHKTGIQLILNKCYQK